MRIAMVGTRGVPARYGGFETCIEEVGKRLVDAGHQVVVYCRGPEQGPEHYLGMKLVWLPALHKRALETLSHTTISLAHLVTHDRPDVALVFNAANAPLLPLLRARGVPVATHVDGLEWQRAKWSGAGRSYYRLAESLTVRWSDALIADAEGIRTYYQREFGAQSELLAYGAPIVERTGHPGLGELGLSPDGYHLVVARMEPENHVHLIVDGFHKSDARKPLVVVGSAPYAQEYIAELRRIRDSRIRFLGAVWDQGLLDQLYANAYVYWHGHSVGGTNPSLLRAIGASAAVNAFDVDFNHEVLRDAGRYFRTAEQVTALVAAAEADPALTRARAAASRAQAQRYRWDDVAEGYELLCRRLMAGELRAVRGLGRRRRPGASDGGPPGRLDTPRVQA